MIHQTKLNLLRMHLSAGGHRILETDTRGAAGRWVARWTGDLGREGRLLWSTARPVATLGGLHWSLLGIVPLLCSYALAILSAKNAEIPPLGRTAFSALWCLCNFLLGWQMGTLLGWAFNISKDIRRTCGLTFLLATVLSELTHVGLLYSVQGPLLGAVILLASGKDLATLPRRLLLPCCWFAGFFATETIFQFTLNPLGSALTDLDGPYGVFRPASCFYAPNTEHLQNTPIRELLYPSSWLFHGTLFAIDAIFSLWISVQLSAVALFWQPSTPRAKPNKQTMPTVLLCRPFSRVDFSANGSVSESKEGAREHNLGLVAALYEACFGIAHVITINDDTLRKQSTFLANMSVAFGWFGLPAYFGLSIAIGPGRELSEGLKALVFPAAIASTAMFLVTMLFFIAASTSRKIRSVPDRRLLRIKDLRIRQLEQVPRAFCGRTMKSQIRCLQLTPSVNWQDAVKAAIELADVIVLDRSLQLGEGLQWENTMIRKSHKKALYLNNSSFTKQADEKQRKPGSDAPPITPSTSTIRTLSKGTRMKLATYLANSQTRKESGVGNK